MRLTRTLPATAIVVALTAPLLWAAGPAAASGGGRRVINAGSCSHHGTFKLVGKHDDAAIETEYQVDTNVAGQRFTVRVTDNGALIAKRLITTSRPSGSRGRRTRPSAGATLCNTGPTILATPYARNRRSAPRIRGGVARRSIRQARPDLRRSA